MKKYVFAVLVMLEAVLAVAWAASLRPMTEQERAFYGATHEVEFTYADLTETDTNTAQQLTFNVYSNTAVQGVCLVVDEAFVGPTNNHFTLSLTVVALNTVFTMRRRNNRIRKPTVTRKPAVRPPATAIMW